MSAPSAGMHSEAAMGVARALGLRLGKPNQEVFAETVLELARGERNLLVVTSDSRGSGKLGPFAAALPEQVVELGIAEQNLVGVAAGLASAGKNVFAVSPACFLAARSLEQIKNDVAYSDHAVKLVGISAGVSYGALGSTHHSLHDLAALRAISNIEIVVPADNVETRQLVLAAARRGRPVYLRFGKAPMFDLPGMDSPSRGLQIGDSRVIRQGTDVCFIATGETVIHALLAAESLAVGGCSCRVISMATIKPLDTAAVCNAAAECKAVITVEEHSVHGGLGEACAGLLMMAGAKARFAIAGIPDEDTVTGSQADIFRHYGLDMEGLAGGAKRLLA